MGRTWKTFLSTGRRRWRWGFHRFTVVGSDGKRVSFAWTLKPGDQTRVVDYDTGKVSVP